MTGKADVTDSALVSCATHRERLKTAGVIVEQIRFTQNDLFSSPSTASMVVMGRNSNGCIHRVDVEGRMRPDVDRAGSPE